MRLTARPSLLALNREKEEKEEKEQKEEKEKEENGKITLTYNDQPQEEGQKRLHSPPPKRLAMRREFTQNTSPLNSPLYCSENPSRKTALVSPFSLSTSAAVPSRASFPPSTDPAFNSASLEQESNQKEGAGKRGLERSGSCGFGKAEGKRLSFQKTVSNVFVSPSSGLKEVQENSRELQIVPVMSTQPLLKRSLVGRKSKNVFTWETEEKKEEDEEKARARSCTAPQVPQSAKKEKATKARFFLAISLSSLLSPLFSFSWLNRKS